jgi:hypothetical protein
MFIRTFQNEKITIPVTILLLVILAYGLLTPWLGFYWDDWPFAWFLRNFGPSEFIEVFRSFRPLLGPIFMGTTALFGGNPFTWQLVGLAIRFFLSLELWIVLRFIWPSQKWNMLWVVFLFTVYPGYQQQWVSLTHVNQELIPLLWLLASFGTTAFALRNGRHQGSLTVLSVILQVLGLFSTEYFFGLEILRLFFIMAIFAETYTDRKVIVRKAGIRWLPYLCVWILDAAWVYAFHHSTVYKSYDINLLSGSSLSLVLIGNEILNTISLAGFASWLDTFRNFSIIESTLTQTISMIILLCTTSAIFVYMRFAYNEKMDRTAVKNDTWGLWVMLIGLIGILAGRLPSWAVGLPLKLEFDYDRFMLSIMLGASMFIVGLATLILKDGKRKILILSLLIGLSTAYQFSISNTFRRDRDNLRAFIWQLVWRMPALQTGTVLLTYELPLKYVSDMQITAPINWIYSPVVVDRKLPYLLLYIKSRFNSTTLPSLQPDIPIQVQYRTVRFTGSTSNSVTIYKVADGCLRVLDPVYGNGETIPGASYFLLNAIPLSNPDQIQTDAVQPKLDQSLFGPEPDHEWCYFYEKAELARQQSDWEQVVKLYDQARKSGLNASTPVENLPFIEGFLSMGNEEAALELIDRTTTAQKELCPAIYTVWERVLHTSPTQLFSLSKINTHLHQNGCKP